MGEFSIDFSEGLRILYAFIFAGLNSLFQFEPQHLTRKQVGVEGKQESVLEMEAKAVEQTVRTD